MTDNQVWLTLRIAASDKKGAQSILSRFVEDEGLAAFEIDQDGQFYDLTIGGRTHRKKVGSASIGEPGGGEFDLNAV